MPNAMMFITPDPFAQNAGKLVDDFIPNFYDTDYLSTVNERGSSGEYLFPDKVAGTNVSRPMTGTQPKPNTYATVRVIDANNKTLKVFNRLGDEYDYSADGSPAQVRKSVGTFSEPNASEWTDWLLQSVQEERTEKTQIVETFGDTYIYAFGEKPQVLAFTGILMNTADFNWKAVFWENWDKFFRATKLVERNARMYITYDDVLVEGYPLNAGAVQSAMDPATIQFSFQFFVTKRVNIEARRGFVNAARGLNSVIRAGYPNVQTDGKMATENRTSLLALMGVGGASKAAIALRDSLALQPDGSINYDSPTANLAARFSFIAMSAMLPTTSQTVGNALAQINAEAAGYAMQQLSYALEDKMNLQHGEVNQWFGYTMQLLQKNGVVGDLGFATYDLETFVMAMSRKASSWAMLNSISGTQLAKAPAGTNSEGKPIGGFAAAIPTKIIGMLK